MHRVKQIKWLPFLMAATIIGIAAFQVYWLHKTYEREKRSLEIRSNMAFRESVHRLQASKLPLEKLGLDTVAAARLVQRGSGRSGDRAPRVRPTERDKMVGLVNVLRRRVNDTAQRAAIILNEFETDSASTTKQKARTPLMQFLYEVDMLQDSVTVNEIHAAFSKRMEEQGIDVPFTITRLKKSESEEREYNEVTIGFSNPVTYRLQMGDSFAYLAKRISAPILLSLFIVGFTIVSFALLYRNLLHQRRLADIKNEFISNITHELKTPIATVSVAIEALRSFNASIDPQRSKEYLDISANELQRLSLLVDKVLKLSMFEKREVDLKYEVLNMQDLVAEVTSSMRLQFEKHNAVVHVVAQGDTVLEGDRLHLVSVVFNLLDNALKYTTGNPQINILIKGSDAKLYLHVTDNGIGIPPEYTEKIFEKFFRVPTGNLHNAKGYGLGLSYVAHVVNKHKGTIKVEVAEGGGSQFIIALPKQAV